MKQALVIQAVLMIVLVIAAIALRRSIWQIANVWVYAVGAMMIAVYLVAAIKEISDWWAGFLTIGMILKNLSLAGQLAETFRTGHRLVRVPLAYLEFQNGHGVANSVESVRSSCRTLDNAGDVELHSQEAAGWNNQRSGEAERSPDASS